MNETTVSPRLWPAALWLCLATMLLYAPVRQHEFLTYDDPDYVTGNPRTQAGLTLENVKWAFTEKHSSNWHPLTWMSHMLDCQLFGLNPAGPHLVNVALHAANAVLLLFLLHQLTGAGGRCLIVAGLFALHPLHVESVAWVSERKDVLSTFFFLLTLMAYARYTSGSRRQVSGTPGAGSHRTLAAPERGEGGHRALRWYLSALVCFALGLLSKPMLVTLPCILLLLDFWPLQRIAFQESGIPNHDLRSRIIRLLLEKLPFFVLTVVVCVITLQVQDSSGATVSLDYLPLEARLAQIPVAYVRYLSKTFWPDELAVFYPYIKCVWSSPAVLAAAALLFAITVAAMQQLRARPYLGVGWFWFLGTLVPVIGLVQVGRQSIADRYTYIPHIGLFLALVWLGAELLERIAFSRRLRFAVGILFLGVCGWLTSHQLRHWKNSGTLARQTIRATRNNYVAYAHLAGAFQAEGRIAEAVAAARESLRINPAFAEGHNMLASLQVRQKQLEAALASYQEAARLEPNYPEPRHGLASLYLQLGRFAEAEAESRAALRLMPLHFPSLYTLAQSLHNQHRFDEALTTYRQLDQLRPGLFSSHYGIGSIHVLKGNIAEAIREFEIARRIQPTNAAVHNSLGMLQLDGGQVMEASNHFTQALAAEPANPIANAQVAALLVAARQDERAAPFYRASLNALPDQTGTLNDFAWLLATSWDDRVRNGTEAVKLAERACELSRQRAPVLIGTLAAAYAEAGRFDDAISSAEKARDLAREQRLDAVAARNEELLGLYRARKPYREARP